ncbi:MAG: tRNA (5-methylaminomethyl-2-thiouridine)(34)-methyltransferase MnmD [Bacteroidota bacterium]|nr:tRNA (5-methylaminomethyl-2-thiouridine)(34)-methyltransferase MnmD [Bacteroidota bacterium]
MDRQIITTADGSDSIAIPAMQVTYHSVHGALQESNHVFIKEGLQYYLSQYPDTTALRIFEMGFGTGLNALLTYAESLHSNRPVMYESIEAFPLDQSLYQNLNYCTQMQRSELTTTFASMQEAPWEHPTEINPQFQLYKRRGSLLNYQPKERFHLVYFDAFAPTAQPELWTTEIFRMLHNMLYPGGMLTTYCSKSSVRRAMVEAGFTVHKIPGPPRKREMVRATRSS